MKIEEMTKEELVKLVHNLQDQVNNLTDEVDHLEYQVSDLESEKSDLENVVDDLEYEIDEILDEKKDINIETLEDYFKFQLLEKIYKEYSLEQIQELIGWKPGK